MVADGSHSVNGFIDSGSAKLGDLLAEDALKVREQRIARLYLDACIRQRDDPALDALELDRDGAVAREEHE